MPLDITFRDVCDFIKKDEPSLVNAVDNLLGLTLVCSPLILGPQALMLLPLIAAKNELVKLGKSIYDKFASKNDSDFIARQKRMEISYALICYTAFFEALDQQLPELIRKKLGSLTNVKPDLRTTNDVDPDTTIDGPDTNRYALMRVEFPHPTESLAQQGQRHLRLYQQMTDGFSEGIKSLPTWAELSDTDKRRLMEGLLTIPATAVERFDAQYFELARRFEDFAVWANLQEHKGTKELISSLSEYVQNYAELAKKGATALDIGFSKLHNLVLTIPEMLKVSQASILVQALSKHYNARMNEPIIEKKDEDDTEGPRLRFPKVCEAFVPQSFLVIRQTTKARRMEDEESWKGLTRRSDLGAFLVSYLSSPYSTETPLLILGHPGSGKSLLTTVLAGQLMSEHYTPIKVPLREVNSEAGIISQIEEQISRITNSKYDAWATLTAAFKNNPPLVILDGYDELLQASGKVFSGYLRDVQNFQRMEAEQGRPVRVIVTSRITLIDKATIPQGSTVIRLLEFDKRQRDRWTSIWNKANKDYFEETSIRPFELAENGLDAGKILALAEQPLLLLMLAIYDSERNELHGSKTLDRTVLYDSLLRRFVLREREKKKEFEDLPKSEKEKELEFDMQRLGVAAIGMYNRRKLHILTPELNEDLKFFSRERPISVEDGRPLTQADLLLGSFFFVHKSKAMQKAGAEVHHEETAAFEFLHNTFGEFLTADFVIRQTLTEVQSIKAFKENEVLRPQLDQKLGSADGLSRAWFACLVYTPLYTRPVVLEMVREWITHSLKRRNMPRDQFLAQLDDLVLSQIKRILTKREMPSIMQKEAAQEGYRAPFGLHPLLGHMAIYSVNLVLLRVIVSNQPFIFDETAIGSHEDGTRPWDQLTHIWRSWFSLDNLNGITAVLSANRNDSKIILRSKDTFRVSESRHRLDTFLNIGISISDNIAVGLAGLLLYDPSNNRPQLEDISGRLTSENIDLSERISVEQLAMSEIDPDDSEAAAFLEAAARVVEAMLHNPSSREWDRAILFIRRGLKRRFFGVYDRGRPWQLARQAEKQLRHLLRPELLLRVAEQNPEAAVEMVELWREFGEQTWLQRDALEFIDRALHPGRLIEMSQRSPWIAFNWLQLVRAIKGAQWSWRYTAPLFDRIFDPHYFPEIARRSPLVALSLMDIAEDLAWGDRFHRVSKEIFDKLDPDQIVAIITWNPELGLKWAKLAMQFASEPWLQRLTKGLLERVVHPSHMQALAEWHPKLAVRWLEMTRELGGDQMLRRHSGKVFEHLLNPRQMSQLAESHPDAAVSLLQLAAEVMGIDWLSKFRSEVINDLLSPPLLKKLLGRNPRAFAEGLNLLRVFKPRHRAETLMEVLKPILEKESGAELILKELPLASLPQIRWLAKATGNERLATVLGETIDRPEPSGAEM